MLTTEQLVALIVRTWWGDIERVTPQEIASLAVELGRTKGDHRALALFSDYFLKAVKNFNDDHDTNGEREVLRRMASLGPKILFDVGANVGNWSLVAAAELPDSHIHAFEIMPETFGLLMANIAGQAKIVPNAFGLFDYAGEITMNAFEQSNKLSSLADYPHGRAQKVVCQVQKGDEYMREQGIEVIDILKIDVEGAEDGVLRGFAHALSEKRIHLVQFEYGKVNIITRFLLRDFCEYFNARGYSVGKIYPDFVDFRPYVLDDEDFLGPNYLACRSDRTDIIKLLGRPAH